MNKEVNDKNKKIDFSVIREFVLNNKKTFIVAGVALLLVVIVIVGAVTLFGESHALSKKQQYEKTLKDMGKDFYENYYYERTGKNDEERKTFLSKYSSTGIKIDLENLGRYNGQFNKEKVAELVDSKNKNVCDTKNTRVIIVPKEGYGKTDYEIKVELDCGFETEEEKIGRAHV